jgi:hypothetical protein
MSLDGKPACGSASLVVPIVDEEVVEVARMQHRFAVSVNRLEGTLE